MYSISKQHQRDHFTPGNVNANFFSLLVKGWFQVFESLHMCIRSCILGYLSCLSHHKVACMDSASDDCNVE